MIGFDLIEKDFEGIIFFDEGNRYKYCIFNQNKIVYK